LALNFDAGVDAEAGYSHSVTADESHRHLRLSLIDGLTDGVLQSAVTRVSRCGGDQLVTAVWLKRTSESALIAAPLMAFAATPGPTISC
jgi:hypothetical protein